MPFPTVPEPPTKRKTLAERAGEPLNPLRSHMPAPSKLTFARSEGTTLTQMGARPASSNANHAYRSTSNAATVGSNDSFTHHTGRQNGVRGRAAIAAEPRGAMEEEAEIGIMGKRKGTPVLSFHSPPLKGITLRKTRTQQDLRNGATSPGARTGFALDARTGSSSSASSTSTGVTGRRDLHSDSSIASRERDLRETVDGKTVDSGQSTRNTSLNSLKNAFDGLTLSPDEAAYRDVSSSRHRPSLSRIKEEASPVKSPSKIPKFSCTPSLRHTQSTQSLRPPPSVSPIKHQSSMLGLRTPATTAKKTRPAPGEDLPIFLTKEKLTPVRIAWDTKGRLEDMEQMYHQLRSQFSSAADTKSALEESLSVYKMRGMFDFTATPYCWLMRSLPCSVRIEPAKQRIDVRKAKLDQ